MEDKSKCCNEEIGNVGAYTNRCGECGKDCSTSPTTDDGKVKITLKEASEIAKRISDEQDKKWKDYLGEGVSTPPESWEETYFDILRKCRDEFLSANGLGGISPINKISSFDPLLHFFSQTLSTEKAKWMKEWGEASELLDIVIKKREQVHGFQPFGYTDMRDEEKIYFAGFNDGRAMVKIDLIPLGEKIDDIIELIKDDGQD